MPERTRTLHEAMVAVLSDHHGWMNRRELATQIASRGLWERPSDSAPPEEDQIRLRARRYPDLFDLGDDGSGVRLRRGPASPPLDGDAADQAPEPAAPGSSDVWALTENEVVDACQELLEQHGYTILTTATTTQRGPDLVARSPDGDTEIRIEAKGATSSKDHTKRFGKPFNSGQILQHVSRAFYTAVAAASAESEVAVCSAMAFPDTEPHRARIEALAAAIEQLGIGVFWIDPSRGAELDANWSL